jgi:hypothetical protein
VAVIIYFATVPIRRAHSYVAAGWDFVAWDTYNGGRAVSVLLEWVGGEPVIPEVDE